MSLDETVHLRRMERFVRLSPTRRDPLWSCRGRVGFRTCWVNGTVVLGRGCSRELLSDAPGDALDTSAGYFVAWKIAFGPA
jgi:hypothetical protein